MASGNCWREGQYVRWTKVNFKVLHAAPVQGSHGDVVLASPIGRAGMFIQFDGEEVPYDVIGIDAEKPTTQNVKHTVTIQAHTLLEERVYNSKGNDWKSSEMREYLNSTAFFERFGGRLTPVPCACY